MTTLAYEKEVYQELSKFAPRYANVIKSTGVTIQDFIQDCYLAIVNSSGFMKWKSTGTPAKKLASITCYTRKNTLLQNRFYSKAKGNKYLTSAHIEVDGDEVNLVDLIPHTVMAESRYTEGVEKIRAFVSKIKWGSRISPLDVFNAALEGDGIKGTAEILNISPLSASKLKKDLYSRIVKAL